MRPLHKMVLRVVALTLLAGSALAQNPTSKRLIVEKVDENALVVLRGNTPPAAIAKNDLGPVSANLPMTDLILVLRRSPEMQAGFDAFVQSQYEANSPNYHQWLTPEQVGEKFGPSLADISTISTWLTSHGLSVDEIAKDRMDIRFSGTARQVETTFHTEIDNLMVGGERHIANITDPQIPMALQPVVLGPKALHNFFPRPLHRLGGTVTFNSKTGHWERTGVGASGLNALPSSSLKLNPNFGLTGGTAPNTYQVEDLAPYDFATIYNVLPLWNASINGSGQTIAVAGTSDINLADITTFRSTFGLPAGVAPTIKLAHGTDPGRCTSTANPSATNNYCTLNDQIENALDVEWSLGVAPNAQVVLLVSGATSSTDDTVYDSASYAVSNNVAKILNVSYGLCELGLGTAGNAKYNSLWQTAASAGIAVFVASGDAGSPACDQGGDSSGTPYAAQYGLAVSGLASSQYDTAVGGTDLDWGTTASPYWNASNDTTNSSSAAGYMPEVTWNDSCTNPLILSALQNLAKQLQQAGQNASSPTDAESACNFVNTWWSTIKTLGGGDISFLVDTSGAGGGESTCTTSDGQTPSTCSGGYPTPSWQAGVSGIPTDGKRYVPDVSFFASNGFLGSAYLICVSDWGPCVTRTTTTEPSVGEIGGTSAATPAMAGVMALINQKAGSVQGSPNAQLYQLAAKQNYSNCSTEALAKTSSSSCYFNDVDTNTIAMPCASGSPNCTISHSGDTIGVLTGYSAAAGFDLATGLGTLNVANVVNAWTSAIGTAAATVSVTPTPTSIVANQVLSVAVSVAGSSGTPTGSVTLTGGGYTSPLQSLTSGSTTFSIPANSLSAGSITLTANYGGDGTYAVASGTATVTVTAPPTPTVTVTPASSAINSGQSLAVTGTVSGSNGIATGTVTISGGSYTSSAQTLSGTGGYSLTIPANSLSAGTDTLTASYSGDSTYGVANGTASVTVTQSTYTLAATTPAAVTRGSAATSTVTWTTTNNYSANVTLSSCTLNTGSPANSSADTPKCTVSTAAFGASGSGTATVTTSAATKAALQKPHVGGWAEAGSGALLALLVFFGIPARRRGWRAMVGMIVLMFTLGSLAACGSGGGSNSGGGGGGTSDPGTASGTYTFTVTSTGSDPAKTTGSTTFTVTVN